MWRQSNFRLDPDSDLSISDDEESDGDFPGDCISVGGHNREQKEEGLRLQSRLEMLTGAVQSYGRKDQFSSEHNSIKQTSSYFEDEVEMPDSPSKRDGILSTTFQRIPSEELLSDEENGAAFLNLSKEDNQLTSEVPDASGAASDHDGYGNVEKDGINTWSLINKEAEALLYLNNVSCFSFQAHCKADQFCGKSKARSRFSFRFHSNKEVSRPSISKEKDVLPKLHELPELCRTIDTDAPPITQLSEGSLKEREKQLVMFPAGPEALDFELAGQSMSEILDSLLAKGSHLRKNFQMQRGMGGKTEQLTLKKSLHTLGDHYLDGEDSPEDMYDGLSSDEEAHCRDMKLAIPGKKGTMTERFQEALGPSYEDAFVAAPKSLGIGLFGKLQLLMQREKEMDAIFSKISKVQETKSDESAFDVKIISRYLDAKLTVCHCSLVGTMECDDCLERMEGEGDRRTIIFSPRICSNVDLEIGNTIRICHPWREVQAPGCRDKVVLSAYFCQISA